MAGDQSFERRRRQRFLAKEGCLVSLGNNPIKPWQILDISEEGLSFRYIGGADEPKAISELDILTGDTALCIERIPVRLISDFIMSSPVTRRYPLNRCSVQFGPLTEDQMGRLAFFLKDYTALPPSPAQ